MAIGRYPPRKLTNGIIKNIYKSEEDINIEVSSIDPGYPNYIYKTAIFEDNDN